MAKPQVQEINALTGEIVVRDYTAAELAEVEQAILEQKFLDEAKIDALAKKAAAEAKLAALGLTPDDLRALGL